MSAEEAMKAGMRIAEDHDIALQEMARAYFPDIPLDQLAKLVHGNKVWLGTQIMKAMLKTA